MHRDNRPPRFQRVKAPDKGELEELVQLISQRADLDVYIEHVLESLSPSHSGMALGGCADFWEARRECSSSEGDESKCLTRQPG